MQLIFNKPRVLDGKLYLAGKQPQTVPDKFGNGKALAENKYFQALVKEGDISIYTPLPAAKEKPAETQPQKK